MLWVDRVEQVDTLSYGYRYPARKPLPIQKEVYQVYPLYPDGFSAIYSSCSN